MHAQSRAAASAAAAPDGASHGPAASAPEDQPISEEAGTGIEPATSGSTNRAPHLFLETRQNTPRPENETRVVEPRVYSRVHSRFHGHIDLDGSVAMANLTLMAS